MEYVQIELFTDAISAGLNAILAQGGKAIAYAKRILNSKEWNYVIIEKECLAIIWALEKFLLYFNKLPVKL